MCGFQWEFQVGPTVGIAAADQVWVARYILEVYIINTLMVMYTACNLISSYNLFLWLFSWLCENRGSQNWLELFCLLTLNQFRFIFYHKFKYYNQKVFFFKFIQLLFDFSILGRLEWCRSTHKLQVLCVFKICSDSFYMVCVCFSELVSCFLQYKIDERRWRVRGHKESDREAWIASQGTHLCLWWRQRATSHWQTRDCRYQHFLMGKSFLS